MALQIRLKPRREHLLAIEMAEQMTFWGVQALLTSRLVRKNYQSFRSEPGATCGERLVSSVFRLNARPAEAG